MNASSPRILIIRLSALGDIIHALPLLAALREQWPAAHLGWLCEPGGAPLLEGHPLLSALHVVPRRAMRENLRAAWRGPMADLTRELRLARYEVALDVQGLTKSAFWGWMANIPRRIGFAPPDSRELAAWLATERVRPPESARHVAERNLELLRPLGVAPPHPVKFPVHLPEAARARAASILGEKGDAAAVSPLVLMALGAGWATKIWPAERFGRLARLLADRRGCRVALAAGPGEEPLVARALEAAGASRTSEGGVRSAERGALPPGAGVWPLPRTTFVELGAVLAGARLMIGGDTGPTHLAAALGVPVVSMMGPLDARRNGPYGPHCVTIQHAIPRRAPFWRNHRRWCDPATDLRGVSVEEIFAACETKIALSRTAGP